MEVIDSLKAELEQVNGKLAALEQMKGDKATLSAQATRLQKAIAMLSGEPIVRKPMSPEAKERIRQGLEKARAAKLAGANTAAGKPQPVTAQTAPAAVGSASATGGKKSVAAEKGEGRGK